MVLTIYGKGEWEKPPHPSLPHGHCEGPSHRKDHADTGIYKYLSVSCGMETLIRAAE
ncbi:hypothetical protein [Methanothermobacter sp.]|uniref:hypothetical protein n=1 Tax=Methanothermobacter sp. TaxID=1884223 RepID=UPI003C7167D9